MISGQNINFKSDLLFVIVALPGLFSYLFYYANIILKLFSLILCCMTSYRKLLFEIQVYKSGWVTMNHEE